MNEIKVCLDRFKNLPPDWEIYEDSNGMRVFHQDSRYFLILINRRKLLRETIQFTIDPQASQQQTIEVIREILKATVEKINGQSIKLYEQMPEEPHHSSETEEPDLVDGVEND